MVAFIDTNTVLEHVGLEQIDWRKVLDSEKVEIIVAPVVLDEINDQKDRDGGRRKKKARAFVSWYKSSVDDDGLVHLRDDVVLKLLVNWRPFDFEANGLDRIRNDDKLIAAVLQFQDENPSELVRIITADILLTARAKQRRIQICELPEQYRITEEKSSEEKQIRELQRENEALRLRAPCLTLEFETGAKHLRLSMLPDRSYSEAEIKDLLKAEEAKYAPMDIDRTGLPGTMVFEGSLPHFVIDWDGARYSEAGRDALQRKVYNDAREPYFWAYEHYLRLHNKYIDAWRQVAKFGICLKNEGTMSAEGVLVTLIFPVDILISDGCHLPREPIPPQPPKRPGEKGPVQPYLYLPYDFEERTPLSLTNSLGEYRAEFTEVRHLHSKTIGPFFVDLNTEERTAKFQIRYRIEARNLPQPAEDILHVAIGPNL